ncbi:Linker histone H1/H5 [Fusarium oxysporum f. sp. vasinfectum]|nr:Linker histone H1/H5 [Fusarium oxysporum f. sp. vasinfectum]KAK2937340.1 Linker histone H1/H5 [Fusarium oxysporum f. sp. vasinfectum]
MAPRGARRSEVAEPQAIYKLGERGRKTGVELIDTGNRDEYGMQPLDDLLSSPEKETGSDQRYDDEDEGPNNDQYESGDDEDEDGSEDMDIETIPGPGPQTVLRGKMQYPIPRSRSPVKTTLMSSPRRNPNLEHLSSPTRAPYSNDRDATVTRKIDFGAKPSLRGKATANGVNGGTHDEEDADETEDAPEASEEGDVADDMDLLDKSLELTNKASAKDKSQRAEPEPRKPGKRGRPAKARPVEEEPVEEEPVEEEPVEEEPQEIQEPGKGRRGRKPKTAVQPKKSAAPESRKRPAPEEPEEAEEHEEPDNEASDPEPEPEESPKHAKRPRTEASKPSKPAKSVPAAASKPRGRPGRKPKAQTAGDVGDTSIAAIQHRPPMPKKRGLVSVRHNPDEVKTTRSGRHSFRPLNWWAGDKVVQEEEEFKDVSGRDRFVLSTIKEIIRAPQEEPPAKPRTKARGRAKSKPVREVEVVEPEEWELNPGVVNAEVILWEPEHETNPPGDEEPVEVMEDRVAISGEAIQTRVVQNVSFRMAKTLTTPFMGAGVVDLPAGSEKRPKNSRKMHMVFFVHTGKVLVTVNEASFRLSAGGMWFVPRGNYYSITNDYDTDSRIFFTQGCEISAQPAEPDQSQMSMMA